MHMRFDIPLIMLRLINLFQARDTNEQSLFHGLFNFFPPNYSEAKTAEVGESGKLVVLFNMLEKLHKTSHEKIVVVSHSTKFLDVIQAVSNMRGYKNMRLEGSTPTAKRVSMIDNFNSKSSNIFMLLLSSKVI